MNWAAVSAVVEIVGAVAVVATLLYLAVQIRQTRQAGSDALYREWAIENLKVIASAYFGFPRTKEFWKNAEPFFPADVRKLVNDNITG